MSGYALPPTIAAQPIELRRWLPVHRETLVAATAASMDSIRQWMPFAAKELADPDEFLAQAEKLFETGAVFAFGMFQDDDAVGHVTFQARDNVGEVGYWVHAGHRRAGYAAAAVTAVSAAAFVAMTSLRRIEIHCDPANIASAGVAESAGFVFEGIREKATDDGRQITEQTWVRLR